jgi:hypothetical protein
MTEAPLEDNGSGLAPAGEGWFVVNVRVAQWLTSEEGEKQPTGSECYFESGKAEFPQLGFRIHVLPPASRTASTTARTSRKISSSCTASASSSRSRPAEVTFRWTVRPVHSDRIRSVLNRQREASRVRGSRGDNGDSATCSSAGCRSRTCTPRRSRRSLLAVGRAGPAEGGPHQPGATPVAPSSAA